MKKLLLIFLLCLINACTLKPEIDYREASTHLSVGMTKEQVINILGKPEYITINGNQEVMYYESSTLGSATLLNVIFFPVAVLAQGKVASGYKSILRIYLDHTKRVTAYLSDTVR